MQEVASLSFLNHILMESSLGWVLQRGLFQGDTPAALSEGVFIAGLGIPPPDRTPVLICSGGRGAAQIVPQIEHGQGRPRPGDAAATPYHVRQAIRSTRGEAWHGREGAKGARRGGATPLRPAPCDVAARPGYARPRQSRQPPPRQPSPQMPQEAR